MRPCHSQQTSELDQLKQVGHLPLAFLSGIAAINTRSDNGYREISINKKSVIAEIIDSGGAEPFLYFINS